MIFEIKPESDIKLILKVLNKYQFCVVVDEKNNCLGTITDGDLRRSLIKNNDQDLTALDICQRNYKYANNLEEAKRMNKNLKFIPILDEVKKYKATYFKELKTNGEDKLPLVIMAGGKGKRMKHYTKSTPKPLLKIKGIPMIELIIKQAKNSGIEDIFISINYLGEKIKEICKNGEKYDVNISYIEEVEELGTAGALNNKKLQNYENCIVINGDVISDMNFNLLSRFHNFRNNDATLAVKKFSIKNPFGVVKFNGLEYVGIEEKPEYLSYINSGIYVFKTNTFKLIKNNEKIDMPELFKRAVNKKLKVEIYPFECKWNDVGSIEVFEELNK